MFKNVKLDNLFKARRRISNSNTGFTLIELLVSLGLLSLLLISFTSIFVSSLELQLRTESSSSRHQDAQYILTRLFYDVNQASDIASPSTINSQQESITLTVGGEAWTYALSDGNLVLTNPEGTYQLNSYLTSISNFDVTRVGNVAGKASIQVSITVASRISGNAGSPISYTTSFTKW